MVLIGIAQAEALGLASEPADVCYRCVLKGDGCSAVKQPQISVAAPLE
jgi:hypothetical protein